MTSSQPVYFDFLNVGDLHRREATIAKTKENIASGILNHKKTASPNSFGHKESELSTELVLYDETWWHVRKALYESDVGRMSRLIMKTKSVEEHILPTMSSEQIEKINSEDGLRVKVLDVDNCREHYSVLKKWTKPNNYVFIGGWRKEFVMENDLKEGDEIGLIWDAYNTKFYFRVLSSSSN